MEEAAKSFESTISRSQSVAVTDEATKTIVGKIRRISVYGQAEFRFEVAESPEVVVPDVEMHGNAGIRDPCQCALHANAALGNGTLVLEPEIEQVSHHVNRRGSVSDGMF